ncbi:MAG: hypothetical protein O7F70_07930, partial [Gemmatimonadetes bacterium]|nr:hypothetical protein [Gemmatimonadota bacterium]
AADAPHSCSWLASNPAPCLGRPLWYGVTWSLLRWINDHFGLGLGGEKAIQKALVDNSLTGFANIENVVGEPIETLLAEWAATLYLDDRSATALPSRIDFPSWNLFDIFDVGGLPSSARLRPTSVVFQDFTEDVDVRAGSTAYFLLSGNVTAPTAIRVRNQVDGVLPTTMQVFIVRTK